ncbi:MAG: glycerophosphodiester phosphodiesterase [Actinomycetales bacterium]
MARVRPAVESLDWQSSDLPRAGQNARPLAIAHRGDPIAHRENTVAAIRSALDCGADIVEIDVKTTEDGVSVVLHDDSLRRLWGVDRDIRTMSAAEVTGIGIPTLRAVLALFEGRPAAVMVDMDSGEWARAARVEAGSAVSTGRLRQEQVMWCGHIAGMREVRQHDPDARVFLSWGEEALDGPPSDDLVTELRPEAFNPHWQVLESGGRHWAAERHLPVSCWTVDDATVLARILDGGVDAVISNDIRALVAAVEEWHG